MCVFIAFPPVAQQLAHAFMRGGAPGYTERLTGAIALVLMLLPVPIGLLSENLLGLLKGSGRPIADVGSLAGQLVGEVVFALRSVAVVMLLDCSDTVLELAAKLESPG